ncbi:hypothetical protein [Pontibacter rugosus]|uniref:Uncharacterized protein n=1 Tax=Pontibacter rugosus TaxID=1745966 RepID=A0ABW3SIV8_9BACT
MGIHDASFQMLSAEAENSKQRFYTWLVNVQGMAKAFAAFAFSKQGS